MPVTPRAAAAVILTRPAVSASGFEILLAQRNPAASFMGGVWVFPGGSVDRNLDGEDGDALRNAAMRELQEEVGVELLDTDALVPYARWVTPIQLPRRFDTHFFIAQLPNGAEAVPDGEECVAVNWTTPADAIAGEEIVLAFPTIRQLEALDTFPNIEALLHAEHTLEPIEPQVVGLPDNPRIVLPGDAEYRRVGSGQVPG